jgi:hypothetical protein
MDQKLFPPSFLSVNRVESVGILPEFEISNISSCAKQIINLF